MLAFLCLLASKATAVMTNVPKSQAPRYLAGVKLKQQMFWVPQTSNIGIGVSILSYDGKAQFGVITDKGLCPDPGSITERVGREFETLVLAALMCPWGIDGDLDPRKVARAVGIRA